MALESILPYCDPDDPLCGISGGEPDPGPEKPPQYDPYGAVAATALKDPVMQGALALAGAVLPFGVVPAMVAHANFTAAQKARYGALPPQTALPERDRMQPLTAKQGLERGVGGVLGGFVGKSYEQALTEQDLQTMMNYGLYGDLGVTTGGFNISDPKGTSYGYGRTRQDYPGPRKDYFSVHPANRQEAKDLRDAQYQYAKDERERLAWEAWYSVQPEQIAAAESKVAKSIEAYDKTIGYTDFHDLGPMQATPEERAAFEAADPGGFDFSDYGQDPEGYSDF
jgi:hypothetical protein